MKGTNGHNQPHFGERKTLREEREGAMQKLRDTAPDIQSSAVSVHPTPLSGPAMPAEVFYNRVALEDEKPAATDGFDLAMDGKNGV